MDDEQTSRWTSRRRTATAVRIAVFTVPAAVAIGAGLLASRLLPLGDGAWRVAHVAAVLAVSTVVLLAVDSLARRALPLATLLDLTMLFPDRAPSRMRVARDAVRRRTVAEHLAALDSVGDDPAAAAREILTLVAAMDRHDRPTRGHAERVRLFSDLVAEEMGLPRRDRDLLRWASLLHDIGKLTVDPAILNKPGKPSETEWEVLRSHPAAGAKLAAPLLPWLGTWGELIIEHHERFDGTGYPMGLAGEQIGLGGRLVAVADAFDVMTAARAYRRPVSRAAAYRELVRFAGTQFDPACVRAMVGISAPRLRRAQGVVAWLGDVPVLGTQSVPAATLAQVVGAGALVAAAPGLGLVAPVPTLAAAPPSISVEAPSSSTSDRSRDLGPVDRDPGADARPGTVSSQASRAALSATNDSSPPPASPVTGSDPVVPAPVPSDPSSPPPSTSGPGPAPLPVPVPVPVPAPVPVPVPAPAPAPGPVGAVTGAVTGTVTGVVGGTTGLVDDLTGLPVSDLTEPVTDLVDDTGGLLGDTVDGLLGGLLGGGGRGGLLG